MNFGEYGQYIVPAYAAATLILGYFTANAILRHRAARRQLDTLEAQRRGQRS